MWSSGFGSRPQDEMNLLKRGCVHTSFLDPFNERELVMRLAAAEVTAVSMEMIPRTAVAQKMDVLSSQANLSGDVAVIIAATHATRIFPMLITPAGTIKPLRVFVIGVGVAGLQAIATARRLGAAVEVFDTRPVVEEQVKSLGAKFVKVDLGENRRNIGGGIRQGADSGTASKATRGHGEACYSGRRGHYRSSGFRKEGAGHCYH